MTDERNPLDITIKQRAILDQFRKQTSDILKDEHDDVFLLRWLRARDFDMKKSEQMLRDSMKWRKQWNADKLIEWNPPEVLEKYYPGVIIGYDKTGTPVWLGTGNCDIYGMLHSVGQKDFLKYAMRTLEETMALFPSQTAKTGHIVHQMSIIADVETIPYRNATNKPAIVTMISFLKAFEANYPEILKRVYIINASKIFTIVWSICKPFMHEKTLSKIHIYGHDKWKESLLEDIDADVIPVHWGGTRTDDSGDPRCLSLVKLGGPVPESYYFENNEESKAMLEDMDTAIINKGDTLRLEFNIQPGQALRWIFKTEDHDIGFCVKLKIGNGEELEVIPSSRVNCNLVPEEGVLPCSEEGIYIVSFDNSYSYLRSKKLFYTIVIESGYNTEDEDTPL